jgi:cyclopropane fatty-acyl-phospholipid synthase-like methyltransferase
LTHSIAARLKRLMRHAAPLLATLLGCASAPATPPAHAQAHGHHHHGAAHHHRFNDAARWSAVFDAPERDAWQRPEEVIRHLALAPDAQVADVGAGTGYFSARLARAVPQGRVWAVDLEEDMVRFLNARAQREGLANLRGVLVTPSDARIPEPVDVILVVDTHHHIENRPAYYRALRNSLRPNGRVVIIDFTRESPEGPPAEFRLTPAQVDAEMSEAGYTRDGEGVALPRQYMLTYRPRAGA